jgi:hypothetical protein
MIWSSRALPLRSLSLRLRAAKGGRCSSSSNSCCCLLYANQILNSDIYANPDKTNVYKYPELPGQSTALFWTNTGIYRCSSASLPLRSGEEGSWRRPPAQAPPPFSHVLTEVIESVEFDDDVDIAEIHPRWSRLWQPREFVFLYLFVVFRKYKNVSESF